MTEERITVRALHDSFVERQDLHLWELERRTYMPIWGVTEANAICQRSLTSGTFFGDVTHSTGFVQAHNNSSGMDYNATPVDLGMTTGSGWYGVITKFPRGNHQYLGCLQSAQQIMQLRHTVTPAIPAEYCDTSAGRLSVASATDGVISFRRHEGVSSSIRRAAAGRTVLVSQTQADAGTLPTINIYAMCRNNAGTADQGGTSDMSGWWHGVGVTDEQDAVFTANILRLWETCTQLRLPATAAATADGDAIYTTADGTAAYILH